MGWSYDDHTEFLHYKSLIEKFSLDRADTGAGGDQFHQIRSISMDCIFAIYPTRDLCQRIMPFFLKAGYQADESKLMDFVPIIQQRMVTLDEAPSVGGVFFEDTVNPNPADLIGAKMTAKNQLKHYRRLMSCFPNYL